VGKIIPLLNDKILAEYEEVISRPKFKNTQESIDFFMNGMKNHGIFVDAKDFDDVLPDPKDKIFYCVLMTAREDVDAYLVTGNLKHFPKKLYIVTPRELLDIVESDGD
ncbi:MAG: toxin PIN, partial [Selenomonadaceae bacterium]|nr:toxin PIN [Selenomonadaceae bacterium]